MSPGMGKGPRLNSLASWGLAPSCGLVIAADRREADSRVREAALALVDSKLPFSTLSFVRFDINEWEVLDSVVSYDIDISL